MHVYEYNDTPVHYFKLSQDSIKLQNNHMADMLIN